MQNIDLICVGKLNAKYFAEGVTFLLDVMSSKGVKSAAKQQIGGERKCG